MNREIKFEYGFQSQNGIVKKVYELAQIPRIAQICDIWNELPIAYVREFSGLKDKNGKEIYEGDILGFEVEKNFRNVTVHHFVVTWDFENAGWIQFSPKDKIVVIGNIYEHPELLKN
jgi:hypothetical protein